MKFKFKIQDYQTQAVASTVDVFKNQTKSAGINYRIDLSNKENSFEKEFFSLENGFRNNDVLLSKDELLENINNIQKQNGIQLSQTLNTPDGFGICALDLEMETGTGKTYVYIKTIFELNKQYGWTKFIIVVPSIAIREGVKKSFEMLEEHFMLQYKKKAKYFIYNSSNLNLIQEYCTDNDINIMIINTQAFTKSLKEGGTEGKNKIIYSKRDEFNSYRPIDSIASNKPIIIMDEPQKMGGVATLAGIKNFNPLFVLSYSATHKTKHNTIYALDPLDAFEKKLVKKIKVKGFEINNLQSSDGYLYLDEIILSTDEPPKARIEIEVNNLKGSIKRKSFVFRVHDDIFKTSNNLNQYRNYVISDINVNQVEFTNGIILQKGEIIGDKEEGTMQRIQIRETIKSHFEKEQQLFELGIKTLSLFFIDKVDNYKQYDESGNEIKGVLQKIFEEEYNFYVEQHKDEFTGEYKEYLSKLTALNTQSGYFSIDKKTNHIIDSKESTKENDDDVVSTYDLILKNKERLLSLSEPTRFIFSHSALREGWDNPNVFQICLLKHLKTDKKIAKNQEISRRQEIGRGLRLCVDNEGNRIDFAEVNEDVHKINELTVITNESFSSFIDSLQKETKVDLRPRPNKVDLSVFKNIILTSDDGTAKYNLTIEDAEDIISYFKSNDYIDKDGNINKSYSDDKQNGCLEPLPKKYRPFTVALHNIVDSVINNTSPMSEIIENANKTLAPKNSINKKNANKQEWVELWDSIKNKYTYLVSYDSKELIQNSINEINKTLFIDKLSYTVTKANQESFSDFKLTEEQTKNIDLNMNSSVKYDLIGEISKGANITRKTTVEILKNITKDKFDLFKINPEQFINKVSTIISEQKSSIVIANISYNKSSDDPYDLSIFTQEKQNVSAEKVKCDIKKHITNVLYTDSQADNGVENKFAESLELAEDVCVYAKLPRSFKIPTPVGGYSPDWAISFKKGSHKHIFFVAETKGNTNSFQLRPIEQSKIECAKVLFNKLNLCGDVKYHAVATYQDLLNDIANDK